MKKCLLICITIFLSVLQLTACKQVVNENPIDPTSDSEQNLQAPSESVVNENLIDPASDSEQNLQIRNNSGNRGLVVKAGKYYFVNLTDGLYRFDESLEEAVKIFDGYTFNLNRVDNKIYFCGEEESIGTWAEYALNIESLKVEKLFDVGDASHQYYYEGYFYACDGNMIIRINEETHEVEKLVENDTSIFDFTIHEGAVIYRSDDNKKIMKYDIASGESEILFSHKGDSTIGDVFMYYGDEFYYRDRHAIYKLSKDKKQSIVANYVAEADYRFIIYEGKCYFNTFENGHDVLCRVDIDGRNLVKIYDGSAVCINIAGDRLFFTVSNHGKIINSLKLDGTDLRELNSVKVEN